MNITEESLNHFLGGATIFQVWTYPPDGLHIVFENRGRLEIYAIDNTLDVHLLGPPVAESPNVEQQVEVEG